MSFIAYLFLRLRPPENVVRSMCKKFRFTLPFRKEHGKQVSTLLKSERQHLYHIYWSMGRQLSWKKSLLVICKILRLFVNTLSAVDKYYFPNRDNLTQPIQMQLCQKQKSFWKFFLHLWNVVQIVNIFKKKMNFITFLFLRVRPLKTWLDQCAKSPASDYSSKRTW